MDLDSEDDGLPTPFEPLPNSDDDNDWEDEDEDRDHAEDPEHLYQHFLEQNDAVKRKNTYKWKKDPDYQTRVAKERVWWEELSLKLTEAYMAWQSKGPRTDSQDGQPLETDRFICEVIGLKGMLARNMSLRSH